MKKSLVTLICGCITASVMLAGCGGKKTDPKSTSENGKKDDLLSAPGEFPIVKSPLTLKFFAPSYPIIKDMNTNEFTKYMEDKTGIKIEWQMAPSDSIDEKLNLLMASNSYPDALYGVGLTTAQEAKFGVDEEILLPIDDLIDNNMPEFKKAMEKNPQIKPLITNTDGKVYALPSIDECYHCSYGLKMWINQTWLANLGLKAPETTDDFYNVLKAFKEKDPNKNGKKDEIPLTASTDGWFGNVDSFIMNSFILDSMQACKLVIKDGKVTTAANKDEYKEGLKYLNKLFKEGLISSNVFTQKADQERQLFTNTDGNLVGAFPEGVSVDLLPAGSDLYRQYVTLSPLKGPKGVRQTTHFKYAGVGSGAFAITVDCKHPDAVLRWADVLYSFEGARTHDWGPEGKGWKKSETGATGVNGKQALFKPLVPFSSDPQDLYHSFVGIVYRPADVRLAEESPKDVDLFTAEGLESFLYNQSKNNYEPYDQKDYDILPKLRLLTEENDSISVIATELKKAMDEARVKFITGNLDIDKDWDAYVKNLDKIGLQKYIDVHQKAYERQFKK